MSEAQENSPEFSGWEYKRGTLHCNGLSLEELRLRLRQKYGHLGSPAFVYSSGILRENVKKYKDALQPLGGRGKLSYSLKANSNPHVVKELRDAGVTAATTVSGNEILMALKCGFLPGEIIFNGNGKQSWEVEMAVNRGVLLNIDSVFDAHRLVNISKRLGSRAKALLRLNPVINVQTHPYLVTALADSKFGIEMEQVEEVIKILSSAKMHCNKVTTSNLIELRGVHIHIGSAISDVDAYVEVAKAASKTLRHIQNSGWPGASTINLGGGLCIAQDIPDVSKDMCNGRGLESDLSENPKKSSDSSTATVNPPTPKELVGAVLPYLPEQAVLILEPGRSLVATAGVVMTEMIGVKRNGDKEFIVVDAAMTEIIRPALYGAVHQVSYVTGPLMQEPAEFDIVGPVCESGDFILQRCQLPRPPTSSSSSDLTERPGSSFVIWTTGAYCSSMSSNYNLRPHVVEVMVTSSKDFKVIRSPQSFDDLVMKYKPQYFSVSSSSLK
ncbi:uncharacterized protein LOC135216387 isoform X2 [Macrobrachium nipponense]|uniref:uncharacterized protein LOC135216387 isoform X2 n=1 Tax=Macrobrachium nipponense TaxID=159736 RepID=UPI0030C85492